MDEAVRRIRPDRVLEAAGYVRVSLDRQADGQSPAVQRDAIKKLAAEQGYALTLIEEDHERGSNVSRVGYQKIIEAVRAGTVHAVIVFMFDRWGRDGAEWLTRAREFERLAVPIISVQEGRDEGGLMRFMRAGMAEEYSRQLAKRVRPNKESGARSGTHMGKTPLGYRREYAPPLPNGKRPPGELVADEATAWIVRELFVRYAAGGHSIRDLVAWLNGDERTPPPAGRDCWTSGSIKDLLHNPTYCGLVRYNHRPQGLYERAPEGSGFTVPGRHNAIVDADTFARVQARMAATALRQSYNRRGDRATLGGGLLRCGECGGPTRLSVKLGGIPYYECGWRQIGKPCMARAYLASLAHEALLAQLRRLRGAPWTPQAELRLGGGDESAVADLRGTLAQERERLRRHTRLMTLMENDPSPEQIATFREVSGEISGRIRALEARLAESGQRAVVLPDLRELHDRLSRAEIGAVATALADVGDTEGLRALVQEIVVSARVVERRPESHPIWLRAEVAWHPDIATLLDAGLLRLDSTPEGPPPGPSREEKRRMYDRAYKDRHRAEVNRRNRERRAAKRGAAEGAQ